MKVAKTYKIEESVVEMIKESADKSHEGNLTAALESLIKQAYCMRSIEIDARWAMYSEAKSFNGGFDDKETRTYIDGLFI